MNDEPLLVPLAPDCEAQRRSLIERALPPIWQLDAETARTLHREGNDLVRAGWQPPIDSLPVVVEDLEMDGLPRMRAYRPSGEASGTTLGWLHGGGWVLGGIETSDAICRTICHLTGWEVVSVDYRCAPWHPFPAAVDDSVSAIRWLAASRDRVVVGGDSAGATLSAVVVREIMGEPRLVGQLLLYPATDPQLRSPSARAFVEGPFLTRRDMEWFYDQYLGSASRADVRADLTGEAGAGATVPAVVLTVGHDPLRDEGIAYVDALVTAGGSVEWIHAPELFHGAISQAGVLPSARVRLEQVLAAAIRMLG